MDNEQELDFNLDDIMQQLHEASTQDEPQDSAVPQVPSPEEDASQVIPDAPADSAADETEGNPAEPEASAPSEEAPAPASEDIPASEEAPVSEDIPVSQPTPADAFFDGIDAEAVAQASQAFSAAAGGVTDDTDPLPPMTYPESEDQEETEEDAPEPMPEAEEEAPDSPEPAAEQPQPEGSNTIPLRRSERLRELKRKLVAGPEKRYYSLSEVGVSKLQISMLLNVIVLLLCLASVYFYTIGMVSSGYNKLMIYSQVLAMMVSGLLGIGIIMDGIEDLFHLRYSMNTTLAITFIACMADAWFSLDEKRVPFCSAFVLEMSLAMLARYHSRTTEMAQLDTMRKASSLTSLVKEPGFYGKRAGVLRGEGDVEDFMDTYRRASAPEIVQRVYAFVALLCCIGIAVLTGMLHGTSMAIKIFSTSLLVSFPAGYFITLTRPAALLEKRLHMVGAVICGWQGVRKLCGRAVVPLREKDLFPKGSTKLYGIKIYPEHRNVEVVSYVSSLIFAAGGGLVPLFRNLLASRNGVEYPVEEFRDYGQGSIGGVVNGEPVLIGSLDFLKNMGVEIPEGTAVNQAIYVSVDGQLAAVIAINYARMRSAAAGITSLCGCRKLKSILLADDFMMTESFIREKFSVRTKRFIIPTAEERAELSAKQPDPEADVLALITRDDLISTAYAITGSMSLHRACTVGSFISILGGIVGILTMLALSYLGATDLLTPARILLYQLIWLIPIWLSTEWTRVV